MLKRIVAVLACRSTRSAGAPASMHAPRPHHGHLAAERLRLIHLVGHEQHGGALVVQLTHSGPHVAPRGRVQALGQLVEDHQPRPVEQRQDEEQPLALAAAEGREHRPAPAASPNCSSSSPPSLARAVLNSSTASATRSRSGSAES